MYLNARNAEATLAATLALLIKLHKKEDIEKAIDVLITELEATNGIEPTKSTYNKLLQLKELFCK